MHESMQMLRNSLWGYLALFLVVMGAKCANLCYAAFLRVERESLRYLP